MLFIHLALGVFGLSIPITTRYGLLSIDAALLFCTVLICSWILYRGKCLLIDLENYFRRKGKLNTQYKDNAIHYLFNVLHLPLGPLATYAIVYSAMTIGVVDLILRSTLLS